MRQHDRSFASGRPAAEVLAAAEGGASGAQVSLAESLAAAGDGAAAALWLRRAVDGGDRYAAALLGVWQILGYHVEEDPAEGVRRVEDALAFRNVDDSGLPDRRMLHAGRPPEEGEKWLLSKWVRDRNQLGRLW